MWGQTRTGRLREQRGRGRRVQPGDRQHGQALGRRGAELFLAGGHEQQHTLGLQTPGREPQRVDRGPVSPLQVVHDAEHRAVLSGLPEQGEHAGRHEKAICAASRRQSQGGLERLRLWRR